MPVLAAMIVSGAPFSGLGRSTCGAAASVRFHLLARLGTGGALHLPNFAGLLAFYRAGLTCFAGLLAGDLVYSAVLFGGFTAMERRSPALAPEGRES